MRLLAKYSLLFIILFSFFHGFSQDSFKKITLENIWSEYTFYPKSGSDYKSMNNGEDYSMLSGSEIIKYSYKTGKETGTIININELTSDTKPGFIEDYEFSPDESKILFTTGKERIYRHSFRAIYWVCDLRKKTLKKLSDGGKQQLATFSPDGDKVCFVRDNNIFIKDLLKNEETQITSDGQLNSVINGAPDWVYEEEFSFSKAFQWSGDGTKLAFYRFDESKVRDYSLTIYGDLYPEQSRYKYPKAGEENSGVTIQVYNVSSKTITPIFTGNEKDIYIPRIKWTADANILSIIRMNRLQNKLEILLADASNGNSKIILTETDKCYIEINDDLTFTKDKKSFIISNGSDGFNHLYFYDMNGNLLKQITKGNWEVESFYGYDEKTGTIYFSSTESSPLKRDLFSIKIDGSDKVKLSKNEGWNETAFSTGFKYFINTFSNTNTPPVIDVCDIKGKEVRTIEDNSSLALKIKEYGFSKKEFFNFSMSNGTVLNGWMIKPKDFNPDKKYPVFMNVYGGPGSQEVEDKWDYHDVWFQMLAQNGYIVACIDNRGTGGRGEEFRKLTYKQLGKYETIDQVEGARYLASLKYADPKRIGIWGWSYGGYMTCLCLTKGADVFKMGIAVAPVTNWRYYDSIYTERYNGLPQDNASGYDDNSPVNFADKLKGKLLIIHGTADDNVHMQNSMEFITKLVAANKQFEMQLYPNSNHSIYTGTNTRYHLYKRMTDFILNNL